MRKHIDSKKAPTGAFLERAVLFQKTVSEGGTLPPMEFDTVEDATLEPDTRLPRLTERVQRLLGMNGLLR